MAKIYQIRYFDDGNKNNYPKKINSVWLTNEKYGITRDYDPNNIPDIEQTSTLRANLQMTTVSDETSEDSYPAAEEPMASLQGGTNSESSTGKIKKLGIQAPSGTKFYLNNSSTEVVIGEVGFYEIDLTGTTADIGSVRFGVDSINIIKANPSFYLIVDFLIEEGS